MGVVGGAVIQALVAVEGRIGAPPAGRRRSTGRTSEGAPAYPAGQKENGEQETQDQAGRTQPHQPGQVQLIVSHDPPRLSDQAQVGGQQRVPLAGGS